MQSKKSLRLIYKINTKQLKKANWNLDLPLSVAIADYPECVVSISDSQMLRWIDELNGVTDVDGKIRTIQNKIKYEKRKPKSKETRALIRNLYDKLYELQFQKDYVCIVMNNAKDYDKANAGFKINGITYRRLLGTNGGVKTSTIVYVNAELYPELKKRVDNGRNKSIPMVPAKLEAYQALTCSGSFELPKPKGFIVVSDCMTRFKEDVIMLDDEQSGEPVMSTIRDYEIENDDSDGFGLMSPQYSKTVYEFLYGEEGMLSGMNTRYAWTKGMLFTFDFLEFAEQVAGSYVIKDVWGDERDIREADVILTESMLKLWDSYESWEDYYENCEKNGYAFSATKTCPLELENVRNTNYQFLQSYTFTDEEINELCKPSVDEIKEVLGLDYRKSLVFLAGFGLNDRSVMSNNVDYCTRALMIEPSLINDKFIRKRIQNMISKRIEMCKRGAIRVNANFAIISGDPYSLCQHIFGLEVTGLLKAGELYHKYWIDKGTKEVACFRAPMTNHNNIVKLRLSYDQNCAHWYQYITTALILNSWDTTRNSLNGADCDGDLFMTTDNPVILRNTIKTPTIVCVQRKAEKKVVEESDIIESNKLAFNDEIGIVTNYVTSMFEVQAGYEEGTDEYEELAYRILCGQLFQQNVIDRIKGIIAKPMPPYWYNLRDNIVKEEDSEEVKRNKLFNQKIAAYRKPYFMTFVYPALRSKNNKHNKNSKNGVRMRFGSLGINTIEDLIAYEPKTQDMIEALNRYDDLVGSNPCTINRICWLFEEEFDKTSTSSDPTDDFDYSILKSDDVTYSRNHYYKILDVYKEYKSRMDYLHKKINFFDMSEQIYITTLEFRKECSTICTNEKELCNIMIDICYEKDNSKQFAWDMVGSTIVDNLLKRNGNKLSYPKQVESGGDFSYSGMQFVMTDLHIDDEDEVEDDYSE